MQLQQQIIASLEATAPQPKPRISRRGRRTAILYTERARFIAFACFALLVALTGGSSRPDIQSLIILRPAAVLFCAYALFLTTAAQLRKVRAPLVVVISFMLVALMQLLPLPVSIWADLPHREAVAKASALVGMDNLARPLSLDPSRTWNTFFALFVPLTAIVLVAIQAAAQRRLIIPLLMSIALLSASVGFLQAISGNGLQLYRIAHRGFPTGLFANKNHQSMMMLWLMLAASWFATTVDPGCRLAKAAVGGAVASAITLFPLLFLTGSRAGLLLSVPTLALCGWLLLRARATQHLLQRAGSRAKLLIGIVSAIAIAPLLLVFGVLALSDRVTALERLFRLDAAADLRWEYLPSMKQMALDYLPFGSGFGSFEKAFNAYEPADMLTSAYMNQAHNDLLQLVIEGGVPALAVLVLALVWAGRRVWQVWRSSRPNSRSLALFLGGSIVLWLTASLVDYPLRTPLAAMLIATLTAWASPPSVRGRPEPNGLDIREAEKRFALGNVQGSGSQLHDS